MPAASCQKPEAKRMNITIYKKEINQFFSSLVGYIAIIVFLIFTGLYTFVFSDSSILNAGFANLDIYFQVAPFLFLFLIPAITMRLFSEEYNKGTIELTDNWINNSITTGLINNEPGEVNFIGGKQHISRSGITHFYNINLQGGFSTKGHSASLIPVFAYGTGAEAFAGIYDNTEIFYKMMDAFGYEITE